MIVALELGLIFSIMSIGIFITFKILNLPDLTIDGSYTLGGVVAAIFTINNHPFLGIAMGMMAGAVAGLFTGLLHTKLRIDAILSGILVMTGLYSINLRILDKPTISIYGKNDINTVFSRLLPYGYEKLIINAIIVIIIAVIIFCFFKTQIGMSLIATGDNEDMVRASSINADLMKIIGLMIGNSCVALSGAIMVSQVGFADISSGTGMMIIGIASIIVGEALFGRKSLLICFIGVIVGAVLYRYILTIAYNLGFEAGDLKLISAVLVIIAIGLPNIKKLVGGRKNVKS